MINSSLIGLHSTLKHRNFPFKIPLTLSCGKMLKNLQNLSGNGSSDLLHHYFKVYIIVIQISVTSQIKSKFGTFKLMIKMY